MVDTNIKPLEELLKAAIFSAYLKKDRSFSVIVVGEPESFKTKTLMKFSDNMNVSIQTDLTYYGIVEDVLPRIQNNAIKTIIMPDMLKAISKKAATARNFITILNALIEEGVHEITLRGSKNFRGARCNILTSMTNSIYFDRRRYWNKIGFPSRVIPFTFSYGETRKRDIFNAIGKYEVPNEKIVLDLPTFTKDIRISSEYTKIAEEYAIKLSESESYIFKLKNRRKVHVKGSIGFRHKWQFQAMLKSFAFMRDDDEVMDVDVEKLREVSPWVNYNFNAL